jgi:Uma2 family endonuclease
MASAAREILSEQEYLALERAAATRSEFFSGQMFAMAGGKRSHNLIASNVIASLNTQLTDRPCQVYPSDMRVKVAATGLYTYPDVSVVCGEERFEDDEEDTLLNPTLIVEVLSKSTEAYDRGDKFAQYRLLESLREYVLISQDQARVERYSRPEGETEWRLAEARDLQESVALNSIGCELPLAAVYHKVKLPAPGASEQALR